MGRGVSRQPDTHHRKLPADIETERSVVGALLAEPGLYTQLADTGLTADDFTDHRAAAIWTAAGTVAAEGLQPDIHLISEQLERVGRLTDIGGASRLLELMARAPSIAGAVEWARIIQRVAHRRRVALLADQIATAAAAGADHDHLLDAFERTVAQRSGQGEPWAVRWVPDAVAEPPEEPTELVEGLIRKGELAVVVAARATGKSWWTYNLATLLARGEGMFLGRLPVRAQANVLICQGELDEWGSYTRWKFLTGHGAPPKVAEAFDLWTIEIEQDRTTVQLAGGATKSKTRTIATVTPALEATIVANGIDVVILDPWAVFFGGNENDKAEVQAALDVLRSISMRTGCAIIIVHHIGKATDVREPEDAWRGSSRLADWASTRVTLVPHYTRKGEWEKAGLTRDQARRVVDAHFLRRNGAGDQFTIEWQPATGWWDLKPDKNTTAPAVDERRGGMNAVDVADKLRASGGRWVGAKEAEAALDRGRSAVVKLLDMAVRAGAILEDDAGPGRPKIYTLPEDAPPTLLSDDQAEPEATPARTWPTIGGVPLDAYEDETPHEDWFDAWEEDF